MFFFVCRNVTREDSSREPHTPGTPEPTPSVTRTPRSSRKRSHIEASGEPVGGGKDDAALQADAASQPQKRTKKVRLQAGKRK